MSEIYIKDSNKDILQQMQRAGFNITTCGNCGEIKLHKTGVDELTCDYCSLTEDISSFPDLYVVEQTGKKDTISVPHIGLDYGYVQVKVGNATFQGDKQGEVYQYEVPLRLAYALQEIHGKKDLEEKNNDNQ